MNARARGFTLVESLIALLLLSIGLLGAGAMLLGALRAHADARLARIATCMVRDMADRIRANPRAGALYATYDGEDPDASCDSPTPCDPAQRARADLAQFTAAAHAAFPGTDTSARVEFEPATGPAAPDHYAITLEWSGPRDHEETRNVVTQFLLAQPVAG
jgi:type IV pilus assembly protein PilV